jgi:acetyl-CoA C-acetyltransferase
MCSIVRDNFPEEAPHVEIGRRPHRHRRHRTHAIGGFQGAFASLTAPQLGSAAIKAAVSRAGVKAEDVSEVLMGCVLPAGQGQAPARQASIGAGLPQSVPCTTVNKMCGSGMKT